MRPKLLFLIADGMGDLPLPQLEGRTPLMAAPTPHMDSLAQRGRAGLVQTIPTGMEPGSDTANMALLGFDPTVHHTGRGPVEAAAKGLDLDPEDLVWRLNLVTVSEFATDGLMRDHSAGHIDPAKAQAIIEDMDRLLGDETFRIHTGVQYRHLLVQKKRGRVARSRTPRKSAPRHSGQAHCPGSGRIRQGPGPGPAGPPGRGPVNRDRERRRGQRGPGPGARDGRCSCRVSRKRTASRAPSSPPWIWSGDWAGAAGMEVLEVDGATALLDTNYQGKMEAALQFLQEGGDFVYLHVEAPDECGHSGNVEDKIEAIRRFDERIVGPIVAALGDRAAYLVACDHLTPIALRTHVSDPAPFLFAAPGMDGAGTDHFDEDTAKSSGLVIEPGHELLPWCLNNAS